MIRVFFVRHGHTAVIGRTIAGRAPGVHLSPEGLVQAERLPARLAAVPVSAIYSSPLERAVETAEPLAKALGLPVETSPAFTEINFGEWTGRTLASLAEDPQWRRFNKHRGSVRIPGGELMLEVQARALDGLDLLHQMYPDQTIMLFTHADVIRAVLAHSLGMHLDCLESFQIDPASVSILTLYPEVSRISLLNGTEWLS